MRILMVASEAAPFAKTGGLADVVGALPRALQRLGHQVDVMLPRYRHITAGEPVGVLTVADQGRRIDTSVMAASAHGVRTLFVSHPEYFDRSQLYGEGGTDYADNAARFAFLCHAAVAWIRSGDAEYDVVHAHDWQAGLLPVLYGGPTVFTIHNLAYQGLFDADWLTRVGLGRELFSVDALEYWGRISFLKGGIVFSRLITTVSPRYAEEIQTAEYGFGFDGILRSRASDLVGILNGIDYDEWNPANDRHVRVGYDADSLDRKVEAKRDLLESLGVRATDATVARPIVALVSRLVDQKGFDLVAETAPSWLKLDATFVLLGTGEPRYEELWRTLATRHPDRVVARIGFDESLAHQIEAGADIFLMPSRFEPCGLNQMYSLRYGTVPVVRAVGGLVDTVRDFDPATGTGTGFTFTPYTAAAFTHALSRALSAYQDKVLWRRLQKAGMARDLSWDESARRYLEVYERATIGRD